MTRNRTRLFKYEEVDPRTSGAKVDMFPLVTAEMSTSFGMNYSVFRDCSIDWTVTYDEALHCLEGEIDIVIEGRSHVLGPRDSIWLPAGTNLTYRASAATVLAVFSPADPAASA